VRINSRQLEKLIGVVGAGLIVAWQKTLDVRISCAVPEVNPNDVRHRDTYIYSAWHEDILAFACVGRPALHRTQVLISQHRDGEYITQIVRRLGASVVRGSTTRGGRAGLLEMAHAADDTHLAITPDGPRGPRRRLQDGVIFLASRTKLPIVPLGFGFSSVWRARSWDRFAVPLPFSLLWCVTGSPIHVPAPLNDTEHEYWRDYVERAMLRCTFLAERRVVRHEARVFPRTMAA
jgi:lysophospholipid acyltransferase (LPLAT)-like uncharacterized protein